jgi:hypothetical protein
MSTFLRTARLLILPCLSICTLVRAQGGPPMLTDDPGTPGNHKWEVNVAYTTERSHGNTNSETPLFDFNFGVGVAGELSFEFPWQLTSSSAIGRQQGLGDATLGYKYRFIDKGDGQLQVSLYPQYTFNSTHESVASGLVDADSSVLLPLQATRSFGVLDVNVEAGYSLHKNSSNEISGGLCVGHEFPHGFEVALEFHDEMECDDHQQSKFFNAGVRYRLGEGKTFLASLGHGVGSASTTWIGYCGIQFNF